MKHLLKLSALSILAMGAYVTVANADSVDRTFHVTCGDVNSSRSMWDGNHCKEGMVTFRASNFPATVSIQVQSYPAGNLIDSAGYQSDTNNQLTFTQTLVPYGGYMVIATDSLTGVVITSTTVYTDKL